MAKSHRITGPVVLRAVDGTATRSTGPKPVSSSTEAPVTLRDLNAAVRLSMAGLTVMQGYIRELMAREDVGHE